MIMKCNGVCVCLFSLTFGNERTVIENVCNYTYYITYIQALLFLMIYVFNCKTQYITNDVHYSTSLWYNSTM